MAMIHKSITENEFSVFKKADNASLSKGGIQYSDGVIVGDNEVDKGLRTFAKSKKKPILDDTKNEDYLNAYSEFYKSVMKK
jgi:starch synthase